MDTIKSILQQWADPPAIYRGAPFWSWNARLDADRLCRQIRSMHAAGMGGFFMHSRYGLKTEYLSEQWFECVRACVEQARELDMKAYLYDEDRWPSGSAGGAITRDNEEFRLHSLAAVDAGSVDDDAESEGVFTVAIDEQGRMQSYAPLADGESPGEGRRGVAFVVRTAQPSGWYNDGAYMDTMNADAVAEFIHVTYQAYADRFGKDFGELVPAIFTDEPNYGYTFAEQGQDVAACIHWTPDVPREFVRRRGYDVRDHLPELVYPSADGAFSKVRHDYRRTVTELFVERFTRQIGQWCDKHDIALTGHMLLENTLETQVGAVGAAMPHYEHMQWPGIDILGDQTDELATAKQCTSVADQLGKRRVLTELYGCTGWDWPLEGHKFIGDWQYAVGVNFRCPHLSHYSLAGGAKRDYPASIIDHSPWWKYYSHVEDYFARLALLLTQGQPARDVLVIHPVESAWGLFTPPAGSCQPLTELQDALKQILFTLSGEHYDWDFGDESILAREANVGGETLAVGRMTYRLVIVPPSITLRATTIGLLWSFIDAGGDVLFVGRPPDRIDGAGDDDIEGITARARRCGDSPDELIGVLEDMLPRMVSIAEDGRELQCVWAMLRKIKGGQILFVQSHDRDSAHHPRVRLVGRRPVIRWDPETGQTHRLTVTSEDGTIELDLELPPSGSALITLGLPVPGATDAPAPPTVIETRTIDAPFDIQLTEPNTLPLDYCRYRVADEPFSGTMPTLKADELIRRRYNLGTRIGREHQPWYLYATGEVDTTPRDRCELKWTFHVTDLPPACKLAVESPQDFEITVNARPAADADGFWVDEDIHTIDITALLHEGDNEVLLRFDYRPDMELEDLYLVGGFGVARRTDAPPAPDNMTLVALPRRLDLGSWVGQGLDFYTAAVLYRMKIAPPPDGHRLRIRLDGPGCTAAAIHVGEKTFVLPWPPMTADITDALTPGTTEVTIELIAGRKNTLGPLHTPWRRGTGPGHFSPDHPDWRFEYYLTDHGLTRPVVVEVLE